MTLNEVAARVKISYQQLQKYEKGVNRLSIDKLHDIAKFLGMEICNFFPGGVPLDKDNLQKIAISNAFGSIEDEESRQLVMKLISKLAAKPIA